LNLNKIQVLKAKKIDNKRGISTSSNLQNPERNFL